MSTDQTTSAGASSGAVPMGATASAGQATPADQPTSIAIYKDPTPAHPLLAALDEKIRDRVTHYRDLGFGRDEANRRARLEFEVQRDRLCRMARAAT